MSVPDTLSKPDIHQAWIENLRTDEVNTFGFAALERVLLHTDLKPGAAVLDAGCGTGTNSAWLANRGFKVTGADFSEFALREATGDGIDYRREDLTALSFETASFDAVICIGVLMHIPDVEKALQELARVLRPGGYLIIAEANANAPETYAFRAYWRIARRNIRVDRTECGVEVWGETAAGPLLSRKTSPGWLTRFLGDRGMMRVARTTGELTELYIYSERIRKVLHRLNRLWFRLRGRRRWLSTTITCFVSKLVSLVTRPTSASDPKPISRSTCFNCAAVPRWRLHARAGFGIDALPREEHAVRMV